MQQSGFAKAQKSTKTPARSVLQKDGDETCPQLCKPQPTSVYFRTLL